jgi:hypothetical protein
MKGVKAKEPSAEKSEPTVTAPSSSITGTSRMDSTSPASAARDDEMVPLLNPIPPSLSTDKVLPEDPAEFRKQLVLALKTDTEKAELLSMIDVVLLLNPHDLEMREARADMLLKQGLVEDAASDFELCCKGGRPSCCR